MPKLVRVFFIQGAIGACMALAVVAILMVYNIGDLRTLALSSPGNLVAILLLTLILATIYAAVQISMYVMLQPWDDKTP